MLRKFLVVVERRGGGGGGGGMVGCEEKALSHSHPHEPIALQSETEPAQGITTHKYTLSLPTIFSLCTINSEM